MSGTIYGMRGTITGSDHGVVPDAADAQILHERVGEWNQRTGPRVGDFLRFADGIMRRFAHDWDEMGLQVTVGPRFGESFYLGWDYLEFSGGLDPMVKRDTITETNEIKNGAAWFFHHDHHTAHNAVRVTVPCRVYETTELPR